MSRSSGATLLALLTTCATLAPVSGQEPDEGWQPTSTYDGKFDWVQMTSGEWLKGEIIVMYDEDLEFDSDEFDELTLGWDDIAQIHTSQIMNVGLTGRREAVGRLFLVGDQVTVIGDETREFSRSEILTLTAGAPKEID